MNRLYVIVLGVFFVVCVASCSKKKYNVPTSAMEPTIRSGSEVFVDHGAYRSTDLSRWDVVTFEPPASLFPSGAPKQTWIMRVIGLPGENLEIGGKQIVVDGKPLSTPSVLKGISYLGMAEMKSMPKNQKTDFTLAENEYFLLGDNSINSNDSRFWGPITRDRITGKLDTP